MLASCSQQVPTPEDVGSTAVDGQYIVVLEPRFAPGGHAANQARAAEIARGLGVQPKYAYGAAIFGFAAEIPAGRLQALQRDPRVRYVEQDQVAHIAGQTVPTGVQRIFADTNGKLNINGSDDLRVDVDVAVLDTGIDLN
ncbi:MAG: protease inhibitor I9 family protein, partial [Deinococcota bacterium]|nr:protease inhibitor I9 family protein [Deinococcota bacterium]